MQDLPKGNQAKVSAINALNQVPISLNDSLSQPVDAPVAAGTATMDRVTGSY